MYSTCSFDARVRFAAVRRDDDVVGGHRGRRLQELPVVLGQPGRERGAFT